MRERKAFPTLWLFPVLAMLIVSCGTNSTSNRVLQSMTVTPATADAKDFSNGQAQFTATGTFSKAPSPAPVTFVAPYSGSWLVDTSIATQVGSGNGTATFQCVAGASGTTKVTAVASANTATGPQMSKAVSATAHLTCP